MPPSGSSWRPGASFFAVGIRFGLRPVVSGIGRRPALVGGVRPVAVGAVEIVAVPRVRGRARQVPHTV